MATVKKPIKEPSIRNAGYTLTYKQVIFENTRVHILTSTSSEVARFKKGQFSIEFLTAFPSAQLKDYAKLVEAYDKWLDTQPKYCMSKKAATLVDNVIKAAREQAYADDGGSASTADKADKKLQFVSVILHTYIAELEQRSPLTK
jgi:hypothetical protein